MKDRHQSETSSQQPFALLRFGDIVEIDVLDHGETLQLIMANGERSTALREEQLPGVDLRTGKTFAQIMELITSYDGRAPTAGRFYQHPVIIDGKPFVEFVANEEAAQ